ncbi:hypothetical protein IFM89_014678 [Coptis chinensis]|uniref:Terpene synthase metal-binding domain-containing protein n=1 Tax=Coptis chinensis TaxID=261450 RepID=A0A835HMH2_9MAGN|nr:hypothetical protein IFM89_014678 [Coptis chinensis]
MLPNPLQGWAYVIMKEQGWDAIPYLKQSAELERGGVPKSIQCYMHETGVSEEVACEYIRHMIGNLWKKMNKDPLDDSFFSQTYIEAVVNLARMAQCMYQYGDGHGVPDRETKDRVLSLLVEPIMEI